MINEKEVYMTFPDKVWNNHYESKLEYIKDPKLYRQDVQKLNNAFKEDAFDYFGIEDNPKKEKLFEIAWSNKHSEGLYAVFQEIEQLVELIE